MPLNFLNTLEIALILIGLPLAGTALTSGLILKNKISSRYIEVFTAFYLGYFLLTWLFAPQSSSTPVIGLPLGESPVMLIIYTLFGIGMLAGIATTRIMQKH